MLLKPNTDTQPGTIVGPDGVILNRPTEMLTTEEAELLRKYKKFLQKRQLREALYCDRCWQGDREDGSRAFVQDGKIGILCRCRTLLYMGQTF